MMRRRSALWRRWRHRLTRIGQLRLRDHLLLAEALVELARARIAIALLPFPRLAKRMGGFVSPAQAQTQAAHVIVSQKQAYIAARIGWAVRSAARHAPFAAVCLPQAMAARTMLRRRGMRSVMHFGTARGDALSLSAHAWLDIGGIEVTGYPVDEIFTEIACLA